MDHDHIKATKSKINKTNRILLKNGVIYVSSRIAGDQNIKGLCLRTPTGNKLMPLKGMYNSLLDNLKVLAKKHPEQFANSALDILNGR